MRTSRSWQRALDFPWEKWTVFLHPAQRELVERDYSGPGARLRLGRHRQDHRRAAPRRFLARAHPDARVLLTTFSDTLANALRTKLDRLLGNEPRLGERIEVHALDAIGRRLYEAHARAGPRSRRPETIARARSRSRRPRSTDQQVQPAVPGDRVGAGRGCLAARRPGRRIATSRGSAGRRGCRRASARCCGRSSSGCAPALNERGLMTEARAVQPRCGAARRRARRPPFDFAVVDEAQDVERAAAALPRGARRRAPERPVLRRRPGPAHLPAAVLVEVARRRHPRAAPRRCGSTTGRRTRSASQADRLLGPRCRTSTATSKTARGTVSVFNGPAPDDRGAGRAPRQRPARSASWLGGARGGGRAARTSSASSSAPRRSSPRAQAAVEGGGLPFTAARRAACETTQRPRLDQHHAPGKGLEFRAVVVMACDDEVIPLQERIETVGDDADLRGGLRHRAAPALRRLHARPRSPAGHRRRARLGVPRRLAGLRGQTQPT